MSKKNVRESFKMKFLPKFIYGKFIFVNYFIFTFRLCFLKDEFTYQESSTHPPVGFGGIGHTHQAYIARVSRVCLNPRGTTVIGGKSHSEVRTAVDYDEIIFFTSKL